MMRCAACGVAIEGDWRRCPLCQGPTVGTPEAGPYPDVPLRFSRRRVLRALALSSLGVIAVSLAVQLFFGHGAGSVGVLRSLWLGVIAMWLVVITAVNGRRNVARSTVYLVLIVGLVCAYWDYLTGWSRWSLTYAVPAICGCSVIALLITIRLMRTEVSEHIVFSGLTVVLGLAPLLFLALGWVTAPWPAAICGGMSAVALAAMQVARGREARHELARYLHL